MNNVVWTPQPKQLAFMSRAEDEVFYGGAAGGGKSDAVVVEATRQVDIPHYKGLILRKTFPQLSELIEKSQRYYSKAFPKARYNDQKHTWTFPSGAKIVFGSLQHEQDKYNYQGKAYDFIAFDELTHFTYEEYIYLKSRNRPNGPGTKVYMRSTGNPGGVGHSWVKARFIDAAEEGRTIWEEATVIFPDGHTEKQWMSRAHIRSSVFDNPALLENDPTYLARLATLPEKERNALLYGDWDTYKGQFFEDFRIEPDIQAAYASGCALGREELKRQRRFVHVIEPFEIPEQWKLYRSFDWGYRRPFSVGWWAVDFEGVAYRILEMYGCVKDSPNEGVKWTAPKVFSEIKRVENEHRWLKGKRITGVADPAIWKEDGGPSLAEAAQKCGVYFQPGDNQRLPGWEQVHFRLSFDENGFPMMYVFSHCKDFIRTIPTLQFDEHKQEDLDTEGEDHIADETRYFCMSRPIKARPVTPPSMYYKSPLHLFLDIPEEDIMPAPTLQRMEVLNAKT